MMTLLTEQSKCIEQKTLSDVRRHGYYGKPPLNFRVYTEPVPLFPLVDGGMHQCTEKELHELADLFIKYFETDTGLFNKRVRVDEHSSDTTTVWRTPFFKYNSFSFVIVLEHQDDIYKIAVSVIHERALPWINFFETHILDRRIN